MELRHGSARANTHTAPRLHPGAPQTAIPTPIPRDGVPGGCPCSPAPPQHAARTAPRQPRCVPAIKPPLRAADDT